MEDKPKKRKPQGKIDVQKVIEGLLAGKKKKDIAVEAGSIAKDDNNKCNAISQVKKSKEYEEKAKPFLQKMEEQRLRALNEIEIKDLSKEKVRDLNDMIDKFTKNIQLLSGGDTEKSTHTISWQ